MEQWDLGLWTRSGSNFTTTSGLGTDSDSDSEQPSEGPSSSFQSDVAALNTYIDNSKADFLNSRSGRNYNTLFTELMAVPHFSVTNCACLGLGNMDYKLDESDTEDDSDARSVEQLAAFEVLVELLSASPSMPKLLPLADV